MAFLSSLSLALLRENKGGKAAAPASKPASTVPNAVATAPPLPASTARPRPPVPSFSEKPAQPAKPVENGSSAAAAPAAQSDFSAWLDGLAPKQAAAEPPKPAKPIGNLLGGYSSDSDEENLDGVPLDQPLKRPPLLFPPVPPLVVPEVVEEPIDGEDLSSAELALIAHKCGPSAWRWRVKEKRPLPRGLPLGSCPDERRRQEKAVAAAALAAAQAASQHLRSAEEDPDFEDFAFLAELSATHDSAEAADTAVAVVEKGPEAAGNGLAGPSRGKITIVQPLSRLLRGDNDKAASSRSPQRSPPRRRQQSPGRRARSRSRRRESPRRKRSRSLRKGSPKRRSPSAKRRERSRSGKAARWQRCSQSPRRKSRSRSRPKRSRSGKRQRSRSKSATAKQKRQQKAVQEAAAAVEAAMQVKEASAAVEAAMEQAAAKALALQAEQAEPARKEPLREEAKEEAVKEEENGVAWLPEGHRCDICAKVVVAQGGIFCRRRRKNGEVVGCNAAVCWRCMKKAPRESFGSVRTTKAEFLDLGDGAWWMHEGCMAEEDRHDYYGEEKEEEEKEESTTLHCQEEAAKDREEEEEGPSFAWE